MFAVSLQPQAAPHQPRPLVPQRAWPCSPGRFQPHHRRGAPLGAASSQPPNSATVAPPQGGPDMAGLIEFMKNDLTHLFDDQGIDASKYDENVQFLDPITKHTSLQGYLFNLAFLKSVFDPTFTLLDIQQTGPYELTTRWSMSMKPTFVRFGLQNLWDPVLKFTGTSVMAVNPDTGRFISHIDTWDAIQQNNFFSTEGFIHMLSQVLDLRRTPQGLESPPYSLLLKKAQYEVRKYDPFLVAEAPGSGPGAFGVLAGYIFGRNADQQSMAMTTPVLTSPEGRMQFYVGGGRTADTAPRPTDGKVEVRQEEGGTFAVAAFSGLGGEADAAEQEARLRGTLVADGLKPGSGWALARYNDPGTLPPFRRNEVLIPLTDFELKL